MKKQISVRIARVCGILAKTCCSLTLPSYLHVWESVLAIYSRQVSPQEGQAVSHFEKDIFQFSTEDYIPFSQPIPTGKSELYSRYSRLGFCEPHPPSTAHRQSSHARRGKKWRPRAAIAPLPVPTHKAGEVTLGKVNFHSQGTQKFFLSREKGRLCAHQKRLNFICNTLGRTPCLWALSKKMETSLESS